MNAKRRAAIRAAINKIEDLLDGLGFDVTEDLKSIQRDEETAYANLPEGLQDGERGEAMQNAIDAIEEAIDTLDTAVMYGREAIEALEQAAE